MFTFRLVLEGLTALGTVVTGVAAVAAFRQLKLGRTTLEDARTWNRTTFALEYLTRVDTFVEIERGLNATFLSLLDRTTPLSADELKRLLSDAEAQARTDLGRFLNAIEGYALAVNVGVADDDVAKRLYGHKFERHFRELKPYIDHMRGSLDKNLFIELETLVEKWSAVPPQQLKYPVPG